MLWNDLEVLPQVKDEVVDTVFVDPPLNLGKKYGANTNDLRGEQDYTAWCKRWLKECVRTLQPGEALLFL
jgi:site-specific DNA-methyltransferase (adenine-specific)